MAKYSLYQLYKLYHKEYLQHFTEPKVSVE